MKVTICGGGSLGLAYAALMGTSVSPRLYVRSQSQAERLNQIGVTAEILGESMHVPIHASSTSEILTDSDIAICLVKYPDTGSLAQVLKASLSDSTTVISLQTGIRPLEEYRASLGADRVVGGVSYLGAKRLSETSVEMGKNLLTVLGLDDVHSSHSAKVHTFVEMLVNSKLEFDTSDNINFVIWQKLVIACSQNSVSALTGSTFRQLRESRGWYKILNELIGEVVAVAKAVGVDLPPGQLDRVFANWESLPAHRASTYTDLQLHRATEVEALNGSIVQLGRQYDIATPLNELLTCMTHMAEEAKTPR